MKPGKYKEIMKSNGTVGVDIDVLERQYIRLQNNRRQLLENLRPEVHVHPVNGKKMSLAKRINDSFNSKESLAGAVGVGIIGVAFITSIAAAFPITTATLAGAAVIGVSTKPVLRAITAGQIYLTDNTVNKSIEAIKQNINETTRQKEAVRILENDRALRKYYNRAMERKASNPKSRLKSPAAI